MPIVMYSTVGRDHAKGGWYWRAARGSGYNAPDEIVDRLRSHGYHYERDDDLIQDLQRRQAQAQRTRVEARGSRSTRGGETIREKVRRNWMGEFAGRGPEDLTRHDVRRNFLGRFKTR